MLIGKRWRKNDNYIKTQNAKLAAPSTFRFSQLAHFFLLFYFFALPIFDPCPRAAAKPVANFSQRWEVGENPTRTRRCKGHLLSISKATVGSSGGKAIDSCPKPEDRPLGLALDAMCIEPIGYVLASRDGPGLAFHGGACASGNHVRSMYSS
jgi:hypothetical protein